MEYIISLKWGGLHGHVVLQQTGGEVVYVLRSSVLRSRPFPVVDAHGQEVFRVCKGRGLLGSTYQIQSDGQTIAIAGSNWLWSQGSIKVAERPVIRCKYGWGMRSTLLFREGTRRIAGINLKPGLGVRGVLIVEDPAFNEPSFLIGYALVFRDWTSRG
jgi:hypothetical protein